MPTGRQKLAQQVERLPLDDALKAAVLEGVENTDAEIAEREANDFEALLGTIPQTLDAVREAVARDRRRRMGTSVERFAEGRGIAAAAHGTTERYPPGVSMPIGRAADCPTCGWSHSSSGLEQFLGRLGISEDMVDNLRGQFRNADIDEYLNAARAYLVDGSGKATTYARENRGKVAAGVAALALGAGLIYAAMNRDRE